MVYFDAAVRLSPHDLDFVLDVLGSRVAVVLGTGSFHGISPATLIFAEITDKLARLKRAEG